MVDAAKRRWFRFSLRTMLVAFTVVAAWLGWNFWLVRERQEFIRAIDWDEGRSAPASIDYPLLAKQQLDPTFDSVQRARIFTLVMFDMHNHACRRYEPTASRTLSLVRTALGDEPRLLLAFYPKPNVTADRARWLFPEAIILVADEPWTPRK
jgi:hypothetical protein